VCGIYFHPDFPKLLNQPQRANHWTELGQTHPSYLNVPRWKAWKRTHTYGIRERRNDMLELIAEICGDYYPVASNALAVISEEELKAQLKERIIRPKNIPVPEEK
jgi:hypothetical protein